jgi:hypothetical protein
LKSGTYHMHKNHYLILVAIFFAEGGDLTRKEVIIYESVKPTTNVYGVRSRAISNDHIDFLIPHCLAVLC